MGTRKKKYCVIWTIDTSLWIAQRNADLIGSAMCKRVDINLGAGGRNIHKQASKNLCTVVVPATFFYLLLARGFLRYSREPEFFYGHEQVFIHESGMTM